MAERPLRKLLGLSDQHLVPWRGELTRTKASGVGVYVYFNPEQAIYVGMSRNMRSRDINREVGREKLEVIRSARYYAYENWDRLNCGHRESVLITALQPICNTLGKRYLLPGNSAQLIAASFWDAVNKEP
jgi:hypothetical protein